MSLKMEVETAVHIASLNLKEMRQPGWVKYCISLFYTPKNSDKKIFLIAQNIDNTMRTVHQRNNEPEIHEGYCQSQKYEVSYQNDPIRDETTYYFKGYIDLQLLDKIQLFINVDLLFSISFKSEFKKINSFGARIRKIKNIFEYLPVCFDHFGTLALEATYHSTLMAFKFETNEDQEQFIEKSYPSFESYFQAITCRYRYHQILNFYNFYRESLEKELSHLQERSNELSKITVNNTKNTFYSKLSQNRKLIRLIQPLQSSNSNLTPSQKQKITQTILEDMLNIKALIYQNWNQFNELVKMNSERIIRKLKQRYDLMLKDRFRANIQSHKIKYHDWTFNKYGNNSEAHKEIVQSLKKIESEQDKKWEQHFLIQDINFFQERGHSIKIFQEIYQTGNIPVSPLVPHNCEHIIFLVHGFQAHRNDFIQFKQCLQARLNVKVHISSANVDKTEDSIQRMGKRLSYEVTKHLQLVKNKYKVSFIGHSMGGIIIRSALQHLKSIQEHFHAYISLCSPHLGYLYESSTLVQAGLWFMNNFDKYESMLELTMRDKQNIRETYLYKLSKKEELNNFKKIAFVASSQDQYVPYCSARAQKNACSLSKQLKNKQQKQIICEMVDNMLCSIEASQISRIDVIFDINKSNFDSFIGRTGHVKFLCDKQFLKHFAIGLDHLLQ